MNTMAKRLDSLAMMLERISESPNKDFLCSIAEELKGIAFDLEEYLKEREK